MLKGNQVDLLINGSDTFDSIFQAIDEAEDYILVQFFIIRNDGTGDELKKRLVRKAEEGVKVYVLMDDIGCLDLDGNYVEELKDAGIDARFFMDFSGKSNRFQLNFRNHRKIVVVDGKKAFIGGHNVGDEYLGKHPVHTPWRDTHVVLEGPIVKAIQIPFVEDWKWATDELLEDLDWTIDLSEDFAGEMEAICLASGPADPVPTCEMFFLSAINEAEKRIWISSPYFVPDSAVVMALQLAAIRGVDVRVIIPENSDSTLVQLSSYSYFKSLEETGVQIYRYTQGFLHQKVMLVDEKIATVGSANFDNRSFNLNFEVTAIVSDAGFASEVESMLLEDFENSVEVDPDVLDGKSKWFNLKVQLARMLAPIQ
ncbi:MAG: cardiolipin synthase [Verrucomicrobiales bacterium]|nr:cardiolipin synthase [Verrucomicrobiales bacterium]